MSAILDGNEKQPPEPWKDKYYRLLNETNEKSKAWSAEENNLYKSILRLIFTYSGFNPEFDEALNSMRATLRKGADGPTRKQVIENTLELTLNLVQENNQTPKATVNPAQQILELTSRLELPEKYAPTLKQVAREFSKDPSPEKLLSALKRLAEIINRSCKQESNKEPIETRQEDIFDVFLDRFSLPGELGAEIIGLRKRAAVISDHRARLELVDKLIHLLKDLYKTGSANNQDNNPLQHEHLKESLLQLVEWLPLSEQSSNRFNKIKSKLNDLRDDKELKTILREIAALVNDLQTRLQTELNEIENYLKKVTARLTDLETHLSEVASSEKQATKNSLSLKDLFKSKVLGIRNEVEDANSIGDIKASLDKSLMTIEHGMDTFLEVERERRLKSEKHIKKLNHKILEMKSETDKLQERINEERNKAHIDALTKIPNRMAYDERLLQEYNRWRRYQAPLSICVIDIDKFKGINDTYGHKAGDKVLVTLAELCNAKTRETDFFARYGGEEFVLLLPETSLDQAMILAEKLRKEVEHCNFHYAQDPVAITISIGIAEFRQDDSIEMVFNRADKALYSAKNSGRNRCVSEH